MTQRYETLATTLRVVGYLWSGPKSAHTYTCDSNPQSLAEAKRIAGDFSELTSAKLVTVKREIVEHITEKRLK